MAFSRTAANVEALIVMTTTRPFSLALWKSAEMAWMITAMAKLTKAVMEAALKKERASLERPTLEPSVHPMRIVQPTLAPPTRTIQEPFVPSIMTVLPTGKQQADRGS